MDAGEEEPILPTLNLQSVNERLMPKEPQVSASLQSSLTYKRPPDATEFKRRLKNRKLVIEGMGPALKGGEAAYKRLKKRVESVSDKPFGLPPPAEPSAEQLACEQSLGEQDPLKSWLDSLNTAQAQAVRCPSLAMRILAGPGSGKTKTLTTKIAYSVRVLGIPASAIVAVTFTNKAAREMKERLSQVITPLEMAQITMGTFHSVAGGLLRKTGGMFGLESNFAIMDTNAAKELWEATQRNMKIDTKRLPRKGRFGKAMQAFDCLQWVSGNKREGRTPSQIIASAESREDKLLGELWRAYEDQKDFRNQLDFDDLLVGAVAALESSDAFRAKVASRFQCVFVDEFQDTSALQFRMMQALSSVHGRITMVGDEDQSIYAWRQAVPQHLTMFAVAFPDADTVILDRNYRSTQPILDAATTVMNMVRARVPKLLWTDLDGGAPVVISEVSDVGSYLSAEITRRTGYVGAKQASSKAASQAASQISSQGKGKTTADGAVVFDDDDDDVRRPLDQVAVLYRSSYLSRAAEDGLVRAGIPYHMAQGVKFWERKEIADVMAYAYLIVNPRDTGALKRIINVPARGIGAATYDVLESYAKESGLSIMDGIRDLITRGVKPINPKTGKEMSTWKPAVVRALVALLELLDRASARADRRDNPKVILEEVIAGVGYEKYLQDLAEKERANLKPGQVEARTQAQERIENVQELLTVAQGYAESAAVPHGAGEDGEDDEEEFRPSPFEQFLTQSALSADPKGEADLTHGQVVLSTIHAAKGLEWDVVFVIGCSSDAMPNKWSNDADEETRLMYVAMTRARYHLYLLYNDNLDPSPYLYSIPPDVWSSHAYDSDDENKLTHAGVPVRLNPRGVLGSQSQSQSESQSQGISQDEERTTVDEIMEDVEPEEVFCTHCGLTLGPKDNFCAKCGTKKKLPLKPFVTKPVKKTIPLGRSMSEGFRPASSVSVESTQVTSSLGGGGRGRGRGRGRGGGGFRRSSTISVESRYSSFEKVFGRGRSSWGSSRARSSFAELFARSAKANITMRSIVKAAEATKAKQAKANVAKKSGRVSPATFRKRR